MKRKVNLVGQSTHTVSLPNKWVKENNIQKGDELDVFPEIGAITFAKSGAFKKKSKEITLNIDGFTYLSLSKYILVLYITNYDKITFTYTKDVVHHPKKRKDMSLKKTIQKITNRFIGVEIISQSSNRTEISCFVAEESPDLKNIEKRIQYLIKETANEILQATEGDYSKFHETIYDHHDNIVKFILYFLRMLNKSDKSENEKKIAFSFYISLDQAVDKIRHLSEKINEYGCSKKVRKHLKEIFDVFFEQFEFVGRKQLSESLIEKRYRLKEKIDKENFKINEFRVIAEIKNFLDTLNEFTEYAIIKSIEMKK